MAGLRAAPARGRQGGRLRLLESSKKVAMAQALYDQTPPGDPGSPALLVNQVR